MPKKSTIKAAETVDFIVDWLKAYAQNAKVNGFVVGISGGIDSAVTSSLCAKTGMKTLCVEMPIHQPPHHVTRAQEHIAQLKQKYPNVDDARADLTPVFESLKTAVPTSQNEHALFLTLANTRARLRMTTLYYYAGLNGLLVAGTGNKVEDFGVGFFTKYGDGGVDLSPIADLMKSDVYALAAYMGVPDSILVAPPTDGLFVDDRSDEDQLGASYDELEWAMLESEKGRAADDFTGREKEAFEIYARLNRANRHKMLPIPVCEIPSDFK
ncbi:NAD(+) synthase [Flavobacterium sp. MAH-1]|uniref:NH(3)-dependent NAD(+) synthetase n=1 Tax=Flavobacterium agri TaxID=2743471 RepID=A0A7Y8Y5M6_9FLAO|nr:NAD(+) synthase [Flavobacterium agri]NUY81711.1 NAD(+) synthase [Flavobacterium agri]NYA71735.1 NAD(+) synthase [Flavobacterium agri]